jgi:hypothetical protein
MKNLDIKQVGKYYLTLSFMGRDRDIDKENVQVEELLFQWKIKAKSGDTWYVYYVGKTKIPQWQVEQFKELGYKIKFL